MTGALAELTLTITKDPKLSYLRILGKMRSGGRSSTKVKENKGLLTIKITASDITALRAATNSIIRELQVVEGSTNVVSKFRKK